ncbi:precorrin-2 dehydrogenase/sirohydrochlorin ferrochelatase family protein [Treponema zioleckii]|uniref:precorrin-2 dehydrogenase/sirohydrochlorin ferrochelatase family protein n=1 Tax=Treponema zioleckii TaxID=331680 RepID=UPI00168B6BD5|nr:bifunctional precorrin-2 dehydrogenase/sirohydrochlorin ferrochelatase [Treponema zioleckii]
MAFFPIFVELKNCLVVGGGKVASRKIDQLSEYAKKITVVSPKISEEIRTLKNSQNDSEQTCQIQIFERFFEENDVEGMSLVIAATNDSDCNKKVASACRKMHIPVNVVDIPELCDFYFPALVRRGELVVGIGTGGKSPAFARNVRKSVEDFLPLNAGEKLEKAAKIREELLAKGKSPANDAAYNEAIKL